MASFVWGFPPPIPTPAHPSVFCLLEAKSCTSASCWQTAGVPCSLPPASLALSSLSPFLLCFWFTPTSSWGLQVTAVPCLPLCSAVSGGFPSGFGDPRDLSSPAPGLCSSLIWCSHNRAAALSGPALSVQRTVPRGQEPLPQLRSLALLPSWSLAQSKPRAGCACSGRRASHREHPMGASPAGEPEPGENFLGFFPPHSNAQDGRITTVR